MILTGQKRITLREICPSATLSTTNLTWTEVGSNACLLDERLATNRLRRGTDFRCIKPTQIIFRESAPTSQTAKSLPLSKTKHLIYFTINSSFMSKIHSTSNINFCTVNVGVTCIYHCALKCKFYSTACVLGG
jgi:hypothetical protein